MSNPLKLECSFCLAPDPMPQTDVKVNVFIKGLIAGVEAKT